MTALTTEFVRAPPKAVAAHRAGARAGRASSSSRRWWIFSWGCPICADQFV